MSAVTVKIDPWNSKLDCLPHHFRFHVAGKAVRNRRRQTATPLLPFSFVLPEQLTGAGPFC
jgi:hypothetical protein